MRFSTAIASFAVLSTASARTLPPFDAIGLPSIATNATQIVDDLSVIDTTLTNLATAIETPSSGVFATWSMFDIGAILTHVIGFSMAVHQAFLDARELPSGLQVFQPETSTAILSMLNDRIYPHAQTALDLLKGVKSKSYIGQLTTNRAIGSYLGSILSEFSRFSDFLVQNMDADFQGPIRGTLDNIGKVLNETLVAFNQ